MSNISSWTTSAASNNASPPDGAPEGMQPSAVNDVIRENMGAVRRWYVDAEWINHGDALVRQTNNSFLVSRTATEVYTAGRRIKLYDSTTIYGSVIASSASGANTLVTVSSSNLSSSLSSGGVGIINPKFSSAPMATAAEILTGTTTSLLMTPGDFAGNKDLVGAAGYYKLPGGLILQWDQLTTNATGDVTWTYPTAFASGALAVVCTARSGDTAHMVSVDAPGTTTCGIHVRAHDDSQPSTVVLFAVAIGV